METIAEGIERKGIEIGLEEGKKIGIEKGIQQGIEKGEKIGMEKGIFNIAKNMLQKHVEIDFISDITGLSLEQIKALRTVLG
jgi:predicted transposase/invertase (TIGR01784 family)